MQRDNLLRNFGIPDLVYRLLHGIKQHKKPQIVVSSGKELNVFSVSILGQKQFRWKMDNFFSRWRKNEMFCQKFQFQQIHVNPPQIFFGLKKIKYP